MSRQRQFGKDLTNTKGPNAPGPRNQYKAELMIDTKKALRKEQVICPICYSVILEPVTFPCKHNICKPCFDIHIWETSINCPYCRRRLSVWCRKAVKENSIVNLQLQKEIENQFPLQVAAQKEKLELPEEERKLDQVLVEFLADDSPRLPPRQFAKTGDIRKEFNEMLSKHLEDLQRAEESATEAFIAKCVTPEEQENIRKLEEKLKLGEGLKRKNEECLGNGANFIKLRTRDVQAVALKTSPDDSKPKRSVLKPSSDSPMSLEPLGSLNISTGAEAEESASEAFIAKCVSPKAKQGIQNLEANLKHGEGLKEKNEEGLEPGVNFIKLRTRTVKVVALKSSPDHCKPKTSKLKPTMDSVMSPEPSVSPKTSITVDPTTSPISANQADPQPAPDVQDQAEVSPDQLTLSFAKESNEILSKHLQDLHRAEETTSEAFIVKCATPEEQQTIRNLEENLKLGEELKEKNEECLEHGVNFIKLRTRTVKFVALKSSPDHCKPKKSKLKISSDSPMSLEASVSSETSTGVEPTTSPISINKADLQPAQVSPDQLTAPCDSLISQEHSVPPKIQPSQSSISINDASEEPAQDFPCQVEVFKDQLTAPCDKKYNENLSQHLEELQGSEECATEDFIATCLTPKERQAIRNLEKSLKLGEGLKERNEECLGFGVNFIKLRARPVKAVDLKVSLDISKPKNTKLEATSNSPISPEPSVSLKIQPNQSPISTKQAAEEPAQDLQHQLPAPFAQEFNETLSEPLQDLYQAGKSAWEAFIAKPVSPKEQEAIRKLGKNLKLGKGHKEKNVECIGFGANFIKSRARPVKAVDLKISLDISKPKNTKLEATSGSPILPELSVSPKIQPGHSPISTNDAAEELAQVFPHQLTAPCSKEFNETLSKPLQDLYQAGKSAWEAFIRKRVSPKEQEAIRKLGKNLKLGKGRKERNEECIGFGANFIKRRARPVKAVDLKISLDISKPKKAKLKATSDSLMSPELSISPKIQPSTRLVRINQAGEQGAQVSPRKAKRPRRQFKTPDDQFENIDVYKMLCIWAGDPGDRPDKIQPKKAQVKKAQVKKAQEKKTRAKKAQAKKAHTKKSKQVGSQPAQVFPLQAKAPRDQFSSPFEQVDLPKISGGPVGLVHQGLHDNDCTKPGAPSSSSAKKSKRPVTASSEKRKIEEQDYQMAVQLRKYDDTLYNLRPRNAK